MEKFADDSDVIVFATDVGMDIPDVDMVVQVGAPGEVAEYVHRIGRTGRAGKKGRAVLILHEIGKYLRLTVKFRDVFAASEISVHFLVHLIPDRASG